MTPTDLDLYGDLLEVVFAGFGGVVIIVLLFGRALAVDEGAELVAAFHAHAFLYRQDGHRLLHHGVGFSVVIHSVGM